VSPIVCFVYHRRDFDYKRPFAEFHKVWVSDNIDEWEFESCGKIQLRSRGKYFAQTATISGWRKGDTDC
jgi:hypothetical protein